MVGWVLLMLEFCETLSNLNDYILTSRFTQNKGSDVSIKGRRSPHRNLSACVCAGGCRVRLPVFSQGLPSQKLESPPMSGQNNTDTQSLQPKRGPHPPETHGVPTGNHCACAQQEDKEKSNRGHSDPTGT